MQNNNYRMPETYNRSYEQVGNPIFNEIIKTQNAIEKNRVNFFAKPKQKTISFPARIGASLNIFNEASFLERHRPPKNINDLIDLEAELGGKLFEKTLSDFPDKKFFYAMQSWYLHYGNKVSGDTTTRFIVNQDTASKVVLQGRKEHPMTADEVQNLKLSTELYYQMINREIYRNQ